jgi:glycosyltransferase involved in cell wall biosynthesis
MARLAYGDAGLMQQIKASSMARAQAVPFAASFLWQALRESRGKDLVHAFWTPMGAISLIVRALRKTPFVLSPLGTDLRALPEFFNRFVITGAQAIVAGGGPDTEVHERLAGFTQKTLHPIFLPIGEARLDAGDDDGFRKEFDLKDEPVISFIARLYEQKDPWTFLQAIPQVSARRPNVRFVIVGDGPLLLLLKEAVLSLGVEKQVIFTGARSDVGSILKASWAFVSLNLEDNCWATTIAEAMHLGVPCIVSDGGMERKLFPHGDAALLIPQEDPGALADAINQLLTDMDLGARLTEGGRGLLEAHRRRDHLIAEETINLYESVRNGA